jgi:hypothetical protein
MPRHNKLALGILVTITLAAAYTTGQATAQPAKVRPIRAPESLLRARAACPNTASIPTCRAALRRAYQAAAWQRSENLKLARRMLGKLTDWSCIHGGEGAWNADTGNGYYGGLQMDASFERTYGRDMLAKHHDHADTWTPREQIIVAQRAFNQGRGYAPWPNTSRACGLR